VTRARTVLVLFVVTALTACGRGTRLADPATPFDRASGDAVVIVGIEANKTTNLEFKLYDPATHVLAGTDIRANGFTARYTLFDNERYTVHRVKPGSYALFEISVPTPEKDWSTGLIRAATLTTRFGRRDSTTTGGGDIRDDALAFSVAAGEIVYVGDFAVSNAYAQGPSKVALRFDEAAARNWLQRYPNIKGDLRTRRPHPAGGARSG